MKLVEDDLINFKVGDIVRFSIEDNEIYSYIVPKIGTIGIIQIQTHSFSIQEFFGVKIPMSVVLWEDGHKLAVFSHDLSKVFANHEQIEYITNKIKSLIPQTGKNNN